MWITDGRGENGKGNTLEAVGTEDVPDGEFCETSNETVPVVKSSAKKSEADLPKLPERLIGAPNENVGKK